jgi:hypothetical protein
LAVFDDALLEVQALAEDDLDAGFFDEVVEDGFGGAGLEKELGFDCLHARAVDAPDFGQPGEVVGAILEAPVFRFEVEGVDALVELQGEAADGGGGAVVGHAEAAAAHAAEALGGLDEHDFFAVAGGFDGCGDAAAGAAIDADVRGGDFSGGERWGKEEGEEEAEFHGRKE